MPLDPATDIAPTSALDRRQFIAAAGGLAAVSLFPSILPAAPVLAEPLNIGVIGVGRQGRAILTELARFESVKVVAVCESDPQRLESAKGRAAGAEAFADHRAMLEKAKGLAAVIVATPTHQHKQPALDALAAGKHVYCEAPLAHTLDDARAIARAASAAKVTFAVGHEGRSNPVYGLARSFFRTDAFKDMVSMRTSFAQKTSWRVAASDPSREAALNWRLDKALSTGLLGEVASHQIDVVHWYRGKHPVSVRASGSIRLHADGRELPDTVNAEFTFEDGAVLSTAATLANSFEGKYELFQGSSSAIKLGWTHGWMFKESDAPTQGWEVYANRQQFHNDVGITLIADATQLASQGKLKDGVGLPNSSIYYALENFIKATATGKPGACSAEDGFRTIAVTLAANRAAESGAAVAIDAAMLKA
ncbi:MAG: Gfo/Idh/MocA family protein [Phycisphaerales bacterium]